MGQKFDSIFEGASNLRHKDGRRTMAATSRPIRKRNAFERALIEPSRLRSDPDMTGRARPRYDIILISARTERDRKLRRLRAKHGFEYLAHQGALDSVRDVVVAAGDRLAYSCERKKSFADRPERGLQEDEVRSEADIDAPESTDFRMTARGSSIGCATAKPTCSRSISIRRRSSQHQDALAKYANPRVADGRSSSTCGGSAMRSCFGWTPRRQ